MPTVHDRLTEQFSRWEQRGRGWQVHGEPVQPEPPFVPFDGHYLPQTPAVDDGRKLTFLSSLFRKVTATPELPPVVPEPEIEPEPTPLVRDSLVELHTSLPADLDISKESFEQFLLNLSLCREPVSFELLGTAKHVSVQFVAGTHDAPLVRRQLQAYFPEAVFQPREDAMEELWLTGSGEEALIVEFGLAREFMFMLASGRLDPFVGIVGSLAELQENELAVFQVLWQAVQQPWAESIVRSVTHEDGKPFFVNMPELAKAAEDKVSRPLFAAVVRLATKAETFDRALQIACDVAGSLRVFANPHGNELIPLKNDDYPFEEHVEDLLRRQSRRSGMLLNTEELSGFVHLPTAAVRSPKLRREAGRTCAAPAANTQTPSAFVLGHNTHAGVTRAVSLTPEERCRHTHLLGVSGTGKSTLLFNLIRQDIEHGEGVAVFDPHGDLIDRILGIIPPERIGDVVLIDPADAEFPVGFNILSAHSDLEKTLLASDLVSVFQRLSTSWGDQMASVLQNAILAFLESSRGGTLADLRRFLIEPAFRNQFLTTVRDPDVVYYWRRGFPQLSGSKSIGPVLTRLETFLAPKPIRYMVSQRENRLDFARIMDGGKIFLAKLAQGQIGKENAFLLGSLFVAKFQETAMARQAQTATSRRPFWLYLDEFHHFITPSMAEILTGARKYWLGLVLAHQELRQLQRDAEVAGAVLSNPYTRVCFRLGDDDARKLAEGFAHFEAKDLQNLDRGQALCRLERSDADFNLAVLPPDDPDPATAEATRRQVITASRKSYATPRAEVEAMLRRHLGLDEPEPDKEAKAAEVPNRGRAETTGTVTEDKAPVSESDAPAAPVMPKAVEEAPVPAPAPKTEPLPEPVTESSAPTRPRDLGIGGAQHQIIQKRIKEAAEALGFRVTIEKPILDRRGSVDVLLERGDESIPCEISISTTVDHEVGNLSKCFEAGFATVAMIAGDERRLQKIADAARAALGAETAARVIFQTPDGFIEHLRRLSTAQTPPPLPAQPTEKLSRGRKVRLHFPKATAEERAALENSAVNALAELLRRKPA